jgi:hypothetical protein
MTAEMQFCSVAKIDFLLFAIEPDSAKQRTFLWSNLRHFTSKITGLSQGF